MTTKKKTIFANGEIAFALFHIFVVFFVLCVVVAQLSKVLALLLFVGLLPFCMRCDRKALVRVHLDAESISNRYTSLRWEDIEDYSIEKVSTRNAIIDSLYVLKATDMLLLKDKQDSSKYILLSLSSKNIRLIEKYNAGKSPAINRFLSSE